MIAYFGIPGALDTIMKNALVLKENGLRVSFAMSILDFNIARNGKNAQILRRPWIAA